MLMDSETFIFQTPDLPEQRWRRLRPLLIEPIVHFAVLAAVIFAANAVFNPSSGASRREIVVGQDDLQRLRALAMKQFGQLPDPERLRQLVRAHVREEVLVREALADGLDRDDAVVRRRLVQKWEFLAQFEVRLPSDPEAQAYYLSHQHDYEIPERLSFEQVLINSGAGAAGQRAVALAALNAGREAGSEPSMLARTQTLQSRAEVSRDFGEPFASAVFAATSGKWQGPFQSALGMHFVRIVSRQPQRLAPFGAVRERARTDLANQDLQQARDAAYARARKRYRIVLPAEAAE
ncbi:MAG: peptidylprolyl isomerase [Pseudomonadota bacterium]